MGVLRMESSNELLCSYACLILADADKDVTADNINAVLGAANCSVPAYYSAMFEKVNGMNSVKDIVKNAGSVGSGAPAAATAGPATGGDSTAAAAAKEESSEEEEIAAGPGLFDAG